MDGSAKSPMDVVAAPLMPTMAAKSVQMSTVPAASPPLSPPIQWYIMLYRSSAMPLFCSIAPMKINMGTATSINMLMAV